MKKNRIIKPDRVFIKHFCKYTSLFFGGVDTAGIDTCGIHRLSGTSKGQDWHTIYCAKKFLWPPQIVGLKTFATIAEQTVQAMRKKWTKFINIILVIFLFLIFMSSCSSTQTQGNDSPSTGPRRDIPATGKPGGKAMTENARESGRLCKIGKKYWDNEDLEKALETFNKAIELDGNNADAYTGRGMTYYDMEKFDLALKDYEKTIKIDPKAPMHYANRGDVYLIWEKYDEAMADYERALKLDPKCLGALYHKSMVYLRREQFEEALEVLNFTIKYHKNFNVLFLQRGFANLKLGKYGESIRDYEEAFRREPTYDVALLGIGRALLGMNKPKKALEYFNRAEELGRKVRAKNRRRENFESDISPALICQFRALAYLELGDHKKAIQESDRYLKEGGKEIGIFEIRGSSYYFDGQTDKAKSDYEKWLKSNPVPEDAKDYFDLGWAYLIIDNKKKALANFNKSIELEPKSSLSHLGRAKAYYEMGQDRKAGMDFEKALVLNPKTPQEKKLAAGLRKEIQAKGK